MNDKILQLRVSLNEAKPFVWRKFLIDENVSFHKLHEVIQVVMGWENYHLYQFVYNKTFIGLPDADTDLIDSRKLLLSQVFEKKKQKIGYEYDFGDSWEHTVLLEKFVEPIDFQKYPVCIGGENACPPEDSGGFYVYQELLEIKKNKKHPEYKEKIVEWLGEDFNPKYFDLNNVNKQLSKKKFW